MTVVLPQQTKSQIGMDGKINGSKHKTLYLLHGLSDDHTIWSRRTSIERYAAAYGLAVIMPQVDRSFYTDMKYGSRYWTFLTEELPSIAHSFFPLSDRREDTFVAGLSMGGYGAFKWALSYPEKFAAAASLSGALDMAGHIKAPVIKPPDDLFRLIYGDGDISGTKSDLLWLLKQADQSSMKPKLYQACGLDDFLLQDNRNFTEACRATSFELTSIYDEGSHEWSYWDAHIQQVLEWLPLNEKL